MKLLKVVSLKNTTFDTFSACRLTFNSRQFLHLTVARYQQVCIERFERANLCTSRTALSPFSMRSSPPPKRHCCRPIEPVPNNDGRSAVIANRTEFLRVPASRAAKDIRCVQVFGVAGRTCLPRSRKGIHRQTRSSAHSDHPINRSDRYPMRPSVPTVVTSL